MSEISLSMREPSVAPRGADAVGSLKECRGGTAVGETREEGVMCYFNIHALHFCRGRISLVRQGGKLKF